MLQCSVGKEYQRLKDSDVQQRQKLEAANHRIAELENQLAKKEQLILDQKKLLEDTKTQSRSELTGLMFSQTVCPPPTLGLPLPDDSVCLTDCLCGYDQVL